MAALGISWVIAAVLIAGDASSLGVKRGRLGHGVFDMGPIGCFFATWFVGVIAAVRYVVIRPQYIRMRPGPVGTAIP